MGGRTGKRRGWFELSFGSWVSGACRCATTDPGPSQPADQSHPVQQDPAGLPLLRLPHPHPALVSTAALPLPAGRAGTGRCPALSALTRVLCTAVRFKNGQGNTLDGGNYKAHENGSLEMNMARKEDQGIYTCVATNILGKAEAQVRLEVKGGSSGAKCALGSSETHSRNERLCKGRVDGALRQSAL